MPNDTRGSGVKRYPPGDAREPVILRVRMRRSLLNRIRGIVEHDRECTQGAWNLSDGVREVLLAWVARREAEIQMVSDAGPFTGEPPTGSILDVRPG